MFALVNKEGLVWKCCNNMRATSECFQYCLRIIDILAPHSRKAGRYCLWPVKGFHGEERRTFHNFPAQLLQEIRRGERNPEGRRGRHG